LLDPPSERGDMRDLNDGAWTIGARGASSMKGKLLGEEQSIELGYYARGDHVTGTEQRIGAATGTPYATNTDVESDLGDIGLYADASLRPVRYVTLRGGMRTDVMTYRVHDRLSDDRTSAATTVLLPRAALIAGPFRHVSLTASYGRGVRSVDPSTVAAGVSSPFQSIQSYEGGMLFDQDFGPTSLSLRSVVFVTHVPHDLVFDATVGKNVLGDPTTRTGLAALVRVATPHLTEAANATLVRAVVDTTGSPVSYVPGVVLRSDTAYVTELPVTLSGRPFSGSLAAGVTYLGPRPLPSGRDAAAVGTLDVSASLGWTAYTLSLSGTNVLDSKYELGVYEYASNFNRARPPGPAPAPAEHFTAGAPRTVLVSFAVNLGGGG
jgi:hypothetical protein